MGWFDTLVNVVDASTNISNYKKLSQMVNQKASDVVKTEFIQSMKNHVFNLGEAAKRCIDCEKSNPEISAIGLNYLQSRIVDLSLTPDIFPEHVDKTYLVNTIDLISQNLQRILLNFSEVVINKVLSKTYLIDNYDSIKYYIENYESFREFNNVGKFSDDFKKTHHIDRLEEIDKKYNGNFDLVKNDLNNANSLFIELNSCLPCIITISDQTNFSLIQMDNRSRFNININVDAIQFTKAAYKKNTVFPVSPGNHKMNVEIDKSSYLFSVGSLFSETQSITCFKKFTHVIDCYVKANFIKNELIITQIK